MIFLVIVKLQHSYIYLFLIMTIIASQFSLSYRASMDKSFYIVQELKELPSWNEGFSISVFTGVSVVSFGLELRVDIVNHCWIEKNLKLLLL